MAGGLYFSAALGWDMFIEGMSRVFPEHTQPFYSVSARCMWMSLLFSSSSSSSSSQFHSRQVLLFLAGHFPARIITPLLTSYLHLNVAPEADFYLFGVFAIFCAVWLVWVSIFSTFISIFAFHFGKCSFIYPAASPASPTRSLSHAFSRHSFAKSLLVPRSKIPFSPWLTPPKSWAEGCLAILLGPMLPRPTGAALRRGGKNCT